MILAGARVGPGSCPECGGELRLSEDVGLECAACGAATFAPAAAAPAPDVDPYPEPPPTPPAPRRRRERPDLVKMYDAELRKRRDGRTDAIHVNRRNNPGPRRRALRRDIA